MCRRSINEQKIQGQIVGRTSRFIEQRLAGFQLEEAAINSAFRRGVL
jgi:hypothetical protein